MNYIYKLNSSVIKDRLRIKPALVIVLGFLTVIIVGTILLMLPISSRSREWTSPITAFFTATSATCVTGLVVVDTYTYWSLFGQIVIILLIQTGGIGFMTMATLFSLLLKRNIGISERLVMAQGLNMGDMSGIVRLTKTVLLGTLTFEGIGALILSIRFSSDFGWAKGIYFGVFHSISAFCNAGFDLMGGVQPFSNLTYYADDIVVNVVIMSLIVIGGLGFYVWSDISRCKGFKGLSVYSKVVLIVTSILIFGGAFAFTIFEHNNPLINDNLGIKGRIFVPLFQSVTSRTAGFNTVNLYNLTPSSKVLTCMLMFIGGSSGSTAGGIKTFTFAVMVMMVINAARGKRDVVFYGRKINNDNVLRALSLTAISASLILISMFLISIAEPYSLLEIIFECFSAFATVGLTLGITSSLTIFSKIILIVLMFLGRVGILTFTYGIAMQFAKNSSVISYPETKVFIG